MQLPWKASVQEPRYMRHWKSEQRHLDYWIFGLLLLVVLAVLYGLFALSDRDSLWSGGFSPRGQNARLVAAPGILRH